MSSLHFPLCNGWLGLKFTCKQCKKCKKKREREREEENMSKYQAWFFEGLEYGLLFCFWLSVVNCEATGFWVFFISYFILNLPLPQHMTQGEFLEPTMPEAIHSSLISSNWASSADLSWVFVTIKQTITNFEFLWIFVTSKMCIYFS